MYVEHQFWSVNVTSACSPLIWLACKTRHQITADVMVVVTEITAPPILACMLKLGCENDRASSKEPFVGTFSSSTTSSKAIMFSHIQASAWTTLKLYYRRRDARHWNSVIHACVLRFSGATYLHFFSLSLPFFCGKEGILFLWEESKGNCEFVTGGERAGGALFGITRVTPEWIGGRRVWWVLRWA